MPPSTWTPRRLGDLVRLTSGQSPSGFRFASKGKPFFKVDQLGKSAKYLSRASTPYLSSAIPVVPAGSVLIAKRGGAIALNRVRLLTEPGFMDTNVMALTPLRELDCEFLYYWLSYRGLWDVADVTSVPQINNKHINPLEIALPDLAEQRVIVAALKDSDDSIAALERLIVKKQAIKQGLMQQLLTSRTRLPGVGGAWREVPAGEIGPLKGGSGFAVRYQGSASGALPFYKVSDMNNTGNELFMSKANNYITRAQQKAMGAVVMPAGAIIFAKVGAAVFLERKRILTGPSCIDNNVAAFILDEAMADIRFVHYSLTNFPLASLVATGALPSLNGRQLRSIPLMVPPDIAEQQAVAATLDDADAEIAGLQARLTKVQDIRTGMMQQLLTGRTRLPVEASS